MPAPLFSQQALAPYAQSVVVNSPDSAVDNNTNLSPELDRKRKSDILYRLGQASFLGSEGLDVGTTEYGRHEKGYVESNPFYGKGEGRFLATKAAETAGTMLAMHLLSKNHPKLAGLLGLGMSVGPLKGGVSNINLANSTPSALPVK